MPKEKKSNNRVLYILLAVVAVLLITAIIGRRLGWIGGKASIAVEVHQVKKRTIIEKVSASGTVQPVVEVKVSSEVSGEIIELYIEEGDSVIRGQQLLKINPENFTAGLDRAEANLNQQRANLADTRARLARAKASLTRAKQEFDRQTKLFDQQVIAESDYELAKANYDIAVQDLESAKQSVEAAKYIVSSAKASLDEAAENLRRTTIVAPMTGILSKLAVEQGETVLGTAQMQGTEMLRVADLSNMEVRVDVNENDIIKISVGDEASIDVDSYSYQQRAFSGRVTQIANSAKEKLSSDEVTEFEVRIKISNSSYQDLIQAGNRYPFRPGMTASVDIITNVKDSVLSLPIAAVTTRSENKEKDGSLVAEERIQEVVFRFESGKAKQVAVVSGISDFEYIEIIQGIEEGESIISGPFLAVSKRLEDEIPVKVEPEGKD